MKAMQKMSLDIETLIECMMKQFEEMRQDYSDQLKQIEQEFERERTSILDANDAKIKSLFEEHKKIEEDYLKKRQEQEHNQANELEMVMSQDANKQAEQKIKLETEMQILENCMEDMKAVYRLNEEKLQYESIRLYLSHHYLKRIQT